jgi:hypothetical protein
MLRGMSGDSLINEDEIRVMEIVYYAYPRPSWFIIEPFVM